MSIKHRRLGVAALAAVAVTALASSPAAAIEAPPDPGGLTNPTPDYLRQPLLNLQYVTGSPSAEDSYFYKTATVECPDDTVVVGTGFSFVNNDDQVYINHVVPTETTVSVSAYEDETGHSGDWSITAMAACASEPSDYSIEYQRGISGTFSKLTFASCANGSEPLGLGFLVFRGYGEVTVTRAQALPFTSNDAVIEAIDDDTGHTENWRLDAYAICASDVLGLERETVLDPAADGHEVETAPCDTGKRAISAGWDLDYNDDLLVSHAYGYPDQDYSYVIARDDEDSDTTVYPFIIDAICVS
jgi:hypothetical protein